MSREDRLPGNQSDEEAFVTRWSRLKREEQPLPAEQVAAADADAEEAPPLTDADMPPLETLDDASDYSGFMSTGVSESLRNMALRRLFAGGDFNLRDGLDDYDDDFTDFAKLAGIITEEMRHRMAQRAEAKSTEPQVGDEPPAEEEPDDESGRSVSQECAAAPAEAPAETVQEEEKDANLE